MMKVTTRSGRVVETTTSHSHLIRSKELQKVVAITGANMKKGMRIPVAKYIDNDFVKDKQHIKKNDIFNLTVLCSDCHDRLHNGEFKIKQKVLTTNGEKLLY